MVVLELLRWQAPAVLILLVVLLGSNEKVRRNLRLQLTEFFAGEGQICLALWASNMRGSSHDVRCSKLMDLCSVVGFVIFVSTVLAQHICENRDCDKNPLTLAKAAPERSLDGALCLFGLCCNSFTRMQLGLIMRIAGLEDFHFGLKIKIAELLILWLCPNSWIFNQ